jgi:catechol 2,3-dioxygenase-like lactoylglutathione lyase family enzyme
LVGCAALAVEPPTVRRASWKERGRMTRILVCLALVFAPTHAQAEDLAVPPVFFAISVPNLETSLKWYTENLDLTPVRLPVSPKAKVALLKGQGLLVELVEHAEAFDLETRLPGLQGRHLVHGLFKVGFFVRDLDATVTRLKKRGVQFKGSMFTDDVANARSILVLDNNGNMIQLFERVER